VIAPLHLGLVLGLTLSYADEPAPTTEATASASSQTAAAPSEPERVLDPKYRHLRGNQVAFDGFGGVFMGRAIGQSFLAGGRVTYYPIRHIGIGAAYGYSISLGGVETAERQSVHLVHGQLELPLVAGLRVGKHKVLELDLFGEAGAGALYIARTWEPMGVIGGGVRIYPRVPWLGIRIDAVTFLHETRRERGEKFDTDVAFTLGLVFLLPPRMQRPPR
jgi:hypothetical protein